MPSRRERLSRLPAFAQYEERMTAYATDGTDPSNPTDPTDPWGLPPVHPEPPWDTMTSWDTPAVPAQSEPAQRVRVSGPFEALPEDHDEGRRRMSIGIGALAGILSAAAALGVANLVAAFVRPQASPVIAVGDAFIDHTPPWLKNFAVQYFGTNDKNALLIGMYVTITLLAMAIGMIAARHVSVGVIALALFGALGAYVAVTRPESRITDVIPSAAGGLTGMAAISLLAWAGRSKKSLYRTDRADSSMNRRKFLATGGSVAAVAAAAGFGGQWLQDTRFNVNPSSAVKLSKVAGPKLPGGAELTGIPGLTSFYTPNSQFYRIDTALSVPQIDPQSWQLRIHGMVDRPVTLSFNDLLKRPMADHDVTLCCVSESVGGSLLGNARWQGTSLADVLRLAGIQKGAQQIVMRDPNGMNIGVAVDPVMDGRASMLAVGMNGQPLPAEHGFPVRVVVPGLYGYVSACKWVVDMEVTTFGAFDAYWTHRGWSAQAPIKTESRIDTPSARTTVKVGTTTMIAGVAWAQHKGIEAVEVSINGTWAPAHLAVQDTIDTWRQWYFPWRATVRGQHKIMVRATDKTGHVQTPAVHIPEPNGATGYHAIKVTVA